MPFDRDFTLYERLRRRDAEAMGLLLARYSVLLRSFVHGFLGAAQVEDVEEVVNDTLVAVWTDIAEFDPQRAAFKTWIFMKARYCALRRRQLLQARSRHTAPEDLLADTTFEASAILRVELTLALLRLEAQDREIVYLCDVLGWGREAVACRLGITPGALRTRLHRARKRLRRTLRAWRPLVEVGYEED